MAINKNVNSIPVNINVNSELSLPMPTSPRIRRTKQQAQDDILNSAAARLSLYGINGLNLKDIAADTGINHGTILHHFGSAKNMRTELLRKMTLQLNEQTAAILSDSKNTSLIFRKLFKLMSQSGHIKLLAWRAMEGGEVNLKTTPGHPIFDQSVQQISASLKHKDAAVARNLVFLTTSMAVGWSISQVWFGHILDENPQWEEDFGRWLEAQF